MSRWEGQTGGERRMAEAKHGEIVYIAFESPQDMGPAALSAMLSWDLSKHGGDYAVKLEGPLLRFTPISEGAIKMGRLHEIPISAVKRVTRCYVDPTLEPKPAGPRK